MATLQYVIDTICASVTAESMYELVKVQASHRPFIIDEVLPLIQSKDRSLDLNSARMIAEAALEDLTQTGDIRIEDDRIYPAA